MPDNQDDAELLAALADAGSIAGLETYLLANSRLPGPRANLGLAQRYASLAARRVTDEDFATLKTWLAIPATDAPTGDPREFLPFCALQALGALHREAGERRRSEIVSLIRNSASDHRWRVREGAAIALQRIGAADFAALRQIVDAWMPAATLLERRAVLAALAEPPLLRDPVAARYALDICQLLLASVQDLDAAARKSDAFRILRQALEYGPSVIVAALPAEGFAWLRAWATVADPDIRRIVRANLGKARLKTKHPADVQRLLEVMGDG